MKKLIASELAKYRSTQKDLISLRFENEVTVTDDKYHVLVCGGTGCESTKSDLICKKIIKGVEENGLKDKVKVVKTGCFGFCGQGPVIKFMPEHVFYVKVKPEDVDEIVKEHIVNGRQVERLLHEEQRESKDFTKDIDFYSKQERIVLRNCGIINPEDINEYIAHDGYKALNKVLSEKNADKVIEELKTSDLRGRGGGGFPTWIKWDMAKKSEGADKYVVCNGDEGDPGAYMDRSILEGDPHTIIESMAIAGFVTGASKGYFYIRAEYGLAIERVRIALNQAYEMGLLGDDILGTGFKFDLDIRLGAGAFVCGEETALLASIEGMRGTPRVRPPFPTDVGLFGKPTLINNIETFANIAQIILKGGSWFASIGTEKSKGTKVFALTGNVNESGLVEVPMGTTIREIVYDIGGGVGGGKKPKGVQTGGPSGGIIPTEFFDTPIDYDNLKEMGSMMGSGGLIVIDESDSMVDFANFYLGFCVDESCGKCVPCRVGSYQMSKILERFSNGRGREADIQKLRDISNIMIKGSLCGLGQTAPNPVLSTLKHFYSEYEERIFKPKKKVPTATLR